MVEDFERWYRAEHGRLVAALVVSSGSVEVAQDIYITEIGAMPPKLELTARASPKASAKSKLPSEIIETFQ